MSTTKLQQPPLICCVVARLGVAGVNALDVVMLITKKLAFCRRSVVKGFHCFLECYSIRAGLTMVPNVPWHRPPPAVRGPRAKKFF